MNAPAAASLVADPQRRDCQAGCQPAVAEPHAGRGQVAERVDLGSLITDLASQGECRLRAAKSLSVLPGRR